MKPIKKSLIIPVIVFTAFIFFSIQFFVFSNLSSSESNLLLVNRINENVQKPSYIKIRGRTERISNLTLTQPPSTVQYLKKAKVKIINVPINSKNMPPVASCLPFFNIYNLKFEWVDSNEKKSINNSIGSDLNDIRGVKNTETYLYKPDSQGFFKCINSNQRIIYENLNDDYCDCVDGTDEPGTSACQYSKFYCKEQNEYLVDNFILSQKVEDGICDCCDGSDEKLIKCPNKCNHYINKAKNEMNIVRQGLERKKRYLTNGIMKDAKRYGPNGVFFLLSKSCYKIDWSEYTFEVCPFNKVIQFKKNSKSSIIQLGHISSLELVKSKKNEKIWRLKISKGDPSNCSQPRTSEIFFKCGLKDELISVEEPQKCLYKFEMTTPAAC